jgi:hypothetical protein
MSRSVPFREAYPLVGQPAAEALPLGAMHQSDGLDFRDEVMAQIYDPGDPSPKSQLIFRIETSDSGVTKGSQLIKE